MKSVRIPSFDGVGLAVHELGAGPPLMLLHGLFSSAQLNWVKFGTAAHLAEAGWRVILPDLRGHGESESPDHAARWPADVLARDVGAVVTALGLGPDLVLGGYSLGARTVVRCLVSGLRPAAAVLAGMGLDGIRDPGPRSAWFARLIEGAGSFPRGTPEFLAERFMAANVRAPQNLLHLLRHQLSTSPAELAALDLPVLVIAGAEDHDNGSAPALAAALPGGRFAEIPGNHMSAVSRPELGRNIRRFLEEVAGHPR